jgi:hypothetical protein
MCERTLAGVGPSWTGLLTIWENMTCHVPTVPGGAFGHSHELPCPCPQTITSPSHTTQPNTASPCRPTDPHRCLLAADPGLAPQLEGAAAIDPHPHRATLPQINELRRSSLCIRRAHRHLLALDHSQRAVIRLIECQRGGIATRRMFRVAMVVNEVHRVEEAIMSNVMRIDREDTEGMEEIMKISEMVGTARIERSDERRLAVRRFPIVLRVIKIRLLT